MPNILVTFSRVKACKKIFWLSLILMSILIATSCSIPDLKTPVSTPIKQSTTLQPSSTTVSIVTTTVVTTITSPPTASTTPISRPPEINEFLQSGKSVSDINPLEFAGVKESVDQTFSKLFGEAYYASHQSLVDYYNPHDIYKLEQVLVSLVNLTDWQYKEDYFDCSEMTALTEYALEAAGFETLIITSLDPTGMGDPAVTTGHAWCVVVMKTASGSQLVPVEATAPGYPQIPQRGKRMPYKSKGKTGSQAYDEYITTGWVLDNIYEAFRYLPEEFDWWNSVQINRSWFK